MITKEQRFALDAPLPVSAIASREGGAGKQLSYVEGWWVIAQLNRIFPEGWSYDASETREVYREKGIGKNGKEAWNVAFAAKCRLEAGGVKIADVGHGTSRDVDLGKAVESAEKEAATDALKRCAKSLGNVLGLALYDKDKERANVVDDTQVVTGALAEAEAAIKLWPTLDKEGAAQLWSSLSADARRMVREWRESTKGSKAA